MNILFLSRWYPYPPSNGSKLRIYNLLCGLAQHHEVALLSFADQQEMDINIPALQSICGEVQVVPHKPFNPYSARALLGLFSPTPRSMIDTFSLEMKQFIEQKLSANDFGLVIASQIDTAVYGPYFRPIPALFEEAEVGVLNEKFARASSLWHRFRYGLMWTKQRHYLTRLLRYFRACTVVSERERQLLSRAAPSYKAVKVMPNCVDLASYANINEVPQLNTMIFTGSFSYLPNYEAMVWLLREVYPHIRAQLPDVHLTITGNSAGRSLPPASNVTLTGFVDDVRPLIARSWMSVVPLHTGGGTRLKILEAMALGTPVVTTSKGAEGLDVEASVHLLIADSPEAFAQSIIRLFKDPKLRRQLADNAYQLVREKYNWAVVMPSFLNLVDWVAQT